MGDPLSATASVLALVSFAAQSCDYLCQVFTSFSEAPEDLRHHIAALEALRATLKDISTLETALPDEVPISPVFKNRLQELMLDLQSTERLVRPLYQQLRESRLCRTWTRIRWASPNQRHRMKKLLARIDSYHTTFSLDLLLIDIRLGLRPRETVLSCPKRQCHTAKLEIHQPSLDLISDVSRGSIPAIECDESSGTDCSLYRSTQLKPRGVIEPSGVSDNLCEGGYTSSLAATCSTRTTLVATHQSDKPNQGNPDLLHGKRGESGHSKTYAGPSTPSSQVLRHSERFPWRVMLWLGPVLEQRQSDDDYYCSEPAYTVGYGVGFTLTAYPYCPFRFELAGFLCRTWKEPNLGFSIHWNLSLPRVLPWNSEIVRLALAGDVDAVRTGLRTRALTPFDVLPNGSTLLHLAASQGEFHMVEYLLREGAKVNAMNDFGETPLHSAISLSKDYRICQILIENGADLSNRDADGRTPLHTFFGPVVEYVLRCHRSHLELSTQDDSGRNLLHYMAWSSKTTSEVFSMYYGISDVDLQMPDGEGKSILHFAAQRGNTAIVKYFCDSVAGFDYNGRDVHGNTVLHYAVESKRASNIISILAAHGVDIRARNHRGQSALHLAAKLGRVPTVQALLALGSTFTSELLHVQDVHDRTPIHMAAEHNADAVLSFLKTTQQKYDPVPSPPPPTTDDETVARQATTHTTSTNPSPEPQPPPTFQTHPPAPSSTTPTPLPPRPHWRILAFTLALCIMLSYLPHLTRSRGH